jgi:hypothetical protein
VSCNRSFVAALATTALFQWPDTDPPGPPHKF